MNWRLAFSDQSTKELQTSFLKEEGRAATKTLKITDSPRIEVRSNDGSLFRLNKGGEFILQDSPLGSIPFLYGEVYGKGPHGGKYRTSCYIGRSPASPVIEFFAKPLSNADEYFALQGDLIIFEFDKNGKSYDIVSIPEGTSCVVSYTTLRDGYRRYDAKAVAPILDADYQYILANYIDRRNWVA